MSVIIKRYATVKVYSLGLFQSIIDISTQNRYRIFINHKHCTDYDIKLR